MNDAWIAFLGFAVMAVVIRFIAGGCDGDRVREYIEERGGRLLSSNWAPFGKGWFGERSDRIYEVRYVDKEGAEHEATCKTSMFTGVYFTEDRIVGGAQRRPEVEKTDDRLTALELENQQLREELKRAKGGDA